MTFWFAEAPPIYIYYAVYTTFRTTQVLIKMHSFWHHPMPVGYKSSMHQHLCPYQARRACKHERQNTTKIDILYFTQLCSSLISSVRPLFTMLPSNITPVWAFVHLVEAPPATTKPFPVFIHDAVLSNVFILLGTTARFIRSPGLPRFCYFLASNQISIGYVTLCST